MNEAMLALVMMEATQAIVASDSLEDRCRAAMKAAKGHWMVTDEDTQFKGAISAVYAATKDEDERERIRVEVDSLSHLAAMLAGIRIDFDSIKELDNPIGLRGLWMETTR